MLFKWNVVQLRYSFTVYSRYLVWDEGVKSQLAVVDWKIYWEELSRQ